MNYAQNKRKTPNTTHPIYFWLRPWVTYPTISRLEELLKKSGDIAAIASQSWVYEEA